MIQLKQNRSSGFSLIELSIVLLIISVIISMMMFSIKARSDAAKIFVTKERMQTVMDAIDRYVEIYGHLPCPGVLGTQRTEDAYGAEDVFSCQVTPTDIYKGDVPFHALGIDASNIADGWGNRFDYIVVQAYADPDKINDHFLNNSYLDSANSLKMRNAANTDITGDGGGGADIAYAIVSHGANALGARDDKTATQLDDTGISTYEDANVNITTGTTLYQSLPFIDSGDNFDDIVVYKNRWQLPRYINSD